MTNHDLSKAPSIPGTRVWPDESNTSSSAETSLRESERSSVSTLDQTAAAALQISEIRYRRLFEAARDGVLLIDPNTCKITDANPFMTELLGFSHQEFVGKELWEIGLPKDALLSQVKFRELLEKRFVRYENLPLAAITGGYKDVEVVANVYQENGRPVIQCNIRDITQRKALEDQLLGAKDEISRYALKMTDLVAERTAELRVTIGELLSAA